MVKSFMHPAEQRSWLRACGARRACITVADVNTGISMAISDPIDAALHGDALDVVNELGTHAVAHLNRSHFLLAELEPRRDQRRPRIPSDRWYRLYTQLEQTPSPCGVYLLSAATLVDETHVLTERSQHLARHSRRAPVREQVARHLDAVTPWTTQLLDRACALSRPDPNDADDPDDDGADGADGRPAHRVPLVSVDNDVASHAAPPLEADAHQQVDGLVARAVAGDVDARDELLAQIQPMVARYCRARLGRRESVLGSADDVAQDVCMAVISALPNYQLKGLSFRAFVYGIAAHKVTDAVRAIARERTEPVADVPDGPDTVDDPDPRERVTEMAAQMRVLLESLTVRQREVLVLRIAVGLSAEETAAAIGSTPGAVRVTQHRALNQLRRLVSGSKSGTRASDDPTDAVLPTPPRSTPRRRRLRLDRLRSKSSATSG